MLQLEILVGKSFGAVNAGTASAIAIEEVSALDHELSNLHSIRVCSRRLKKTKKTRRFLTYNSVKLAAFVALRPSLRILILACAILAKIFSSLRCDVGEELHLHSAQRLPCTDQRSKYNCQAVMTISDQRWRERLRRVEEDVE